MVVNSCAGLMPLESKTYHLMDEPATPTLPSSAYTGLESGPA